MKVKDLIAALQRCDPEIQVMSSDAYLGVGGEFGRDVRVEEIRVQDEEEAQLVGLAVGALQYVVVA